jgi:hypothetical protein
MHLKASGTLCQSKKMARHLITSTNSYTSSIHQAELFGHLINCRTNKAIETSNLTRPEANKQLDSCVAAYIHARLNNFLGLATFESTNVSSI